MDLVLKSPLLQNLSYSLHRSLQPNLTKQLDDEFGYGDGAPEAENGYGDGAPEAESGYGAPLQKRRYSFSRSLTRLQPNLTKQLDDKYGYGDGAPEAENGYGDGAPIRSSLTKQLQDDEYDYGDGAPIRSSLTKQLQDDEYDYGDGAPEAENGYGDGAPEAACLEQEALVVLARTLSEHKNLTHLELRGHAYEILPKISLLGFSLKGSHAGWWLEERAIWKWDHVKSFQHEDLSSDLLGKLRSDVYMNMIFQLIEVIWYMICK